MLVQNIRNVQGCLDLLNTGIRRWDTGKEDLLEEKVQVVVIAFLQ